MATQTLSIQIDASAVTALAQQLLADISVLKNIPEFPLDGLLCLGDSLLSDFSQGAGASAVVASDDRLVVRLGGNLELFAATVTALKVYAVHKSSSG